MISTVIVTYNSEQVLEDCLKSVEKESDQIVILDLGSVDKTVEIAKKYKAEIKTHEKVEYVEKVRDYAISKADGDWILILDPDERMTEDLWIKLKQVVAEDKYQAVNIPRMNIFFGKWIAHTNWWPDIQVRFFKKGTVSWEDKIHSFPKVRGDIFEIPSKEELAIVHFGYKTIEEFLERQNRYSEIEAKNLFDQKIKFSWFYFFWRPIREFLVRYVKHMGFLDGFYGFSLTFLMMVYQLQVMVKLRELEKTSK